ncbi:MAG: HNH endonuclease [Lachnospiraceae bacterium]|nr:HNH endonuclease [Lachnospiraceae bacterium]
MSEVHSLDVDEIRKIESASFKNIKPETDITVSEAKSYLQSLFFSKFDADRDEITENTAEETKDCQDDEEDIYYSSFEERLMQTPGDSGERGIWSGERGNSDYTPTDQEIKSILAIYGKDFITYKDAIPDFSGVSESTVEIDDMTEKRSRNFEQCDEKCAEQWNKEGRENRNDWSARDVKEWRQEKGYSWHERNDMKTCDLIPTKVNDYFGHLGGVSECKKRDLVENGGKFDE